jgi:hypothetical protein
MMTKRQKRVGCFGMALCILATITWLSWLPIWTSRIAKHGGQWFKKEFQPGKDAYLCIHKDTWATWYFAGTKGLPELKRLSLDSSLTPSGRGIASNLYVHISSGGHLPCVRCELAEGHLPWLGRQYYRYLLRNDTAYLKQRGLPIPEGTQP